jgi:hypothetical protein
MEVGRGATLMRMGLQRGARGAREEPSGQGLRHSHGKCCKNPRAGEQSRAALWCKH